jgi:hypothetical protein
VFASSVHPSSGNQRTGDEGAFVPGTAVDDFVDEFLGSVGQTEWCHVCALLRWMVGGLRNACGRRDGHGSNYARG